MSTRIAKASVAMRKAPRQARSRATVEAVIEAGARILSDEGWAGFTTNKVAEAAGVSIGSLYQYFPDKDALIDAVRRRHLEDSLAAVRGAFAPGKSLARFAEDLADAVIAAHRTHPGLHRVLLDQVPVPDNYMDPNDRFEADYLRCFTQAAAAYRSRRDGASNEVVGLIVSDAIDGVVHNAARRGRLGDGTIRAELIRLVRLGLSD